MKNPFRRRRPVNLEANEIEPLRDHLRDVMFYARMDGSEEAMREAAEHVATDLTARTPRDLAALVGLVITEEAVASADSLREHMAAAVRDLMSRLGRTSGEDAPTDLQEDHEPVPTAEAASEAEGRAEGVANDHAASLRDVAEEKDWPEDRR